MKLKNSSLHQFYLIIKGQNLNEQNNMTDYFAVLQFSKIETFRIPEQKLIVK
jgi:hypothetical protein